MDGRRLAAVVIRGGEGQNPAYRPTRSPAGRPALMPQPLISDGRDKRVGRLVLASCTAFDNYPPKPARPAALL
jgi:hypothetical protein